MDDPGVDDAFRALADRHRRRLLAALLERNPQDEASVPENTSIDSTEADEVLFEFYHTHLPMLEQHGYIEWDRGKQSVSKGPNFDEIRPLLELIDRHRDELPAGWF